MEDILFVSVDDETYQSTWDSAKRNAEQSGSGKESELIWRDLPCQVTGFKLDKGTLTLSVKTDLAFFTVKHYLTDDERIDIITDTTKSLSKLRAAVEALKE